MLPFDNIPQFSLLKYYRNKEVLAPNVTNKIHIENIKSIFNVLVVALMVFKNKNTFIFSSVATGTVFVCKLEYTILSRSNKI